MLRAMSCQNSRRRKRSSQVSGICTNQSISKNFVSMKRSGRKTENL